MLCWAQHQYSMLTRWRALGCMRPLKIGSNSARYVSYWTRFFIEIFTTYIFIFLCFIGIVLIKVILVKIGARQRDFGGYISEKWLNLQTIAAINNYLCLTCEHIEDTLLNRILLSKLHFRFFPITRSFELLHCKDRPLKQTYPDQFQ